MTTLYEMCYINTYMACLTACFLKKKEEIPNTSFSVLFLVYLFSFYLLYNNKKNPTALD